MSGKLWRIGEVDPLSLDGLAELVDCPACNGQGLVFPASGAENCELCQGSGEVEPETAAEWELASLAARLPPGW